MISLTISTFGLGRRRSAVCRILALLITIALLLLVFTQQDRSAALTSNHSDNKEPKPDIPQKQQQSLSSNTDHTDGIPNAERSVESIHKRETSHVVHEHLVSEQNNDQDPISLTDSAFMTDFWSTMTLMPPELSMKALMAPFEEKGDEHLKDVAVRVRSFKIAFQAWERLHGIPSEGMVGVSNILQRLRASGSALVEVRNATQRYDEFRYHINRFGTWLFPGTKLAYGDHMSLHLSFHNAGRGIVLTLGDHQVNMVLTSIRAFRNLGCTLPIEIMYLGEEDLGEEFRTMLEDVPGVVTRDLSKMVDDQGWELKG
jgi:hypothetical protein